MVVGTTPPSPDKALALLDRLEALARDILPTRESAIADADKRTKVHRVEIHPSEMIVTTDQVRLLNIVPELIGCFRDAFAAVRAEAAAAGAERERRLLDLLEACHGRIDHQDDCAMGLAVANECDCNRYWLHEEIGKAIRARGKAKGA